MLKRLTPAEILNLVEVHPEQSKFDWKRDLVLKSEHSKAELVKDIVAIANSHGDDTGYILYGIDLSEANPIVGLTNSHDDAKLQQIVNSKVERPVQFLYHESDIDGRRIGVAVIPPSHARPRIIRANFGSLHEGVIKIRRGSSTGWAGWDDIRQMFENVASNSHFDLDDLIRRAGDSQSKISSVALELWQIAGDDLDTKEIEWLRNELTGYPRKTPQYRKCTAYASLDPLNPYAVAQWGLDNMATVRSDIIKKTNVSIAKTLAELEDDLKSASAKNALFVLDKKFKTTDGGPKIDGQLYFTQECLRSVLAAARRHIVKLLIDLKDKSQLTNN
jgi:Putative DNA-binding domain/AbiTii